MHENIAKLASRISQIILLVGVLGMSQAVANQKPAIVIHGGAGTITKASMSEDKEAAIRATLEASVKAGYQALLDGADSTDAVTRAINVMEDSPLFNAGRGAVFNAEGKRCRLECRGRCICCTD
jgi:beta-aspartyl-peptidase (threonine type)